ncbi:nuclease-related domain-containing protein [Halomonas sp. SpR8]|uniref:nuclease-related domain-containing protein n=1 Tax=Halomonas sp. SpR8 TaxID=3050463 RepID=UPI0027E571B9|nr:nuclease-related domain-containing protein [Halomonas sp. SpR8]MDQ7730937.1 nuclease-related domain-containing protein [Halomonas sp. SpR8]
MAWLEYLLPLIFLFPMAAMAIIVIALRNLHDARVLSPFKAPLHEPGQALRHRLDQAFSSLFINGALGPIVSLAPLVYGMGRMLFVNKQDWVEWALYGLLSTLLVLTFSLLLVRDYQRIRRLKLGLACELAVGQELERLVRPEAHPYYVFHDVPTDSFTIDHVVVTPHGVFVVETRARTLAIGADGNELNTVAVERERLRFPHWQERRPLHKTRQGVDWLTQWLERRCGVPVPVRGILVLPGWQIDSSEAAPDILVVSGDTLAKQITALTPGPLNDATHDKVINILLERARLMELKHLRHPSV